MRAASGRSPGLIVVDCKEWGASYPILFRFARKHNVMDG